MDPSCSLDRTAMAERVAELAALAREGLTGATLYFKPDPEIRARVEAAVAAEAECCSFLGLELEDGAPVVHVTGLTALFSGIHPAWPSSSSSR